MIKFKDRVVKYVAPLLGVIFVGHLIYTLINNLI